MGQQDEVMRWFVMRDLKRGNAKNHAYKMLQGLKFDVYRAQNEAVDGVMAGFWGKCF